MWQNMQDMIFVNDNVQARRNDTQQIKKEGLFIEL